MMDPRLNDLAKVIVNYSTSLKRGEKILIEAIGVDPEPVVALAHPGELSGLALLAPLWEPRFELPRAGRTRLEVFDLRGRLVATLVDGELAAGPHQVTWLGVDRQGDFMRNFFTRIGDLPPRQVPDRTANEMGSLAVARILNIQNPAPREPKKD